ncbi:ATP-binding protein [Flavisolibacter ginsenosidimutans]|uniref:ATP-binding protein n=1 Tax=Flavisolibacter ginsenosidimutans TaxID=661481 RepID=A0A5B8UKA7_9BACT|nr:ATP-binding protein [Flavisolibacter ginsenosidimutans]QEC56832.1 ATP-binding protein [Flavisolibacter ginsenosidimutans]
MDLIHRALEVKIKEQLGKNKVILIMGTRRVGKTVLANTIKNQYGGKVLVMNAEDFDVQELLKNRSIANYKRIIGNATLLIIDEAQVLPDIGQILKLMIDEIPELTIIATGSSSFDLANKTGDPLTGRVILLHLYPLSQAEIGASETGLETSQNLEERLVFGSYPELFKLSTVEEKAAYLLQLVQSYLLKDILAFEGIRQSDKIVKLLRLIAYQCGAEVSYTELAGQLGISKNTVETYLDLLSKVFIVYKVSAYSTNLRKEVSKSSKWFFYDNGIRNAIINDFRLLSLRNDTGLLWENYLLSERLKKNAYQRKHAQYYFWRNYNQQEVDLVEVDNGKITAYEFKYSPTKKVKKPSAFASGYPNVEFEVISKDNYLDWLL